MGPGLKLSRDTMSGDKWGLLGRGGRYLVLGSRLYWIARTVISLCLVSTLFFSTQYKAWAGQNSVEHTQLRASIDFTGAFLNFAVSCTSYFQPVMYHSRFETTPFKQVKNASIGFMFSMVVLSFLLYYRSKQSALASREIASRYDLLNKELGEKELLLKEIHHRVKNNMQIVASLLHLQSNYATDVNVRRTLVDGEGRVRSMALIHQKLYENEDLKHVPFEYYIKDLVREIQCSFGAQGENVQVSVSAPDMCFDTTVAIPLGLMINELATNAFKYAYTQEMTEPQLSICIEPKGEGAYHMSVVDNGVGLPDSVLNTNSGSSLGLKITRVLADQLEATCWFDNTNGTSFHLLFTAEATCSHFSST